MKSKIGFFFGSFNPIHIGHLALANYFLEFSDIDELQLVLSPQNPLKSDNDMASELHRLEMLRLALASVSLPISVCDIELSMPKPSYTIHTLEALQKQHPSMQLVVLMGADSIASIEKWKDYQRILTEFEVCVYPRRGYDAETLCQHYGVRYIDAPLFELSASFIRKNIRKGHNVSAFLPYGVWQYINDQKVYQ